MSYEALGFNPAPGDPSAGQEMVTKLRGATDALGEISSVLAGDGDQQWLGRAAEAFRALMDEDLRPRIDEAYTSFSDATRALDAWVTALPGFQSRADDLERRAQEAKDAVSAAESNVTSASDAPDKETDADKEDREEQLAGHQSTLSGAEGELASIRSEAQTLKGEVDDSASTAASALNTAMEAAPNEPGFWDSVGDFFEGVGEFFADAADFLADVIEYVKDNWWNLLHQLVKISATVLAIASIFCPALAPFALGLAIADVAMSGIDWARGVPGAKEAFLMGAVGLLGGFAVGQAVGAFTKVAGPALAQGPFRLVAAGAGGGGAGGVLAGALAYNPQFGPALTGWTLVQLKDSKDVSDGVMDLATGSGYYSDSLADGWREARDD